MRLPSVFVPALIFAALVGTPESAAVEGISKTGTTGPVRQDNPSDATWAKLNRLLGSGKRVRDFASFVTERGESALLVLFVTGATEPPENAELEPMVSCPSEVAGIPLTGTYHVALVVAGKLINEVTIPGREDVPGPTSSVLSLPLRNTRWFNYIFWGQGPPIEYGAPGFEEPEPTKLIQLADFSGDGHAWEFRIIRDGEACGHKETLLAGYSAKQHQAILYPIVSGKNVAYWHDNFFPPPYRPNAAQIRYKFPCGDHGNRVLTESDFEYAPSLEAWVMTREDYNLCVSEYAGEDRSSRPTPTLTDIQLHIGSARGLPGDMVTIPVTLDPRGAEVNGVQIEMPLDPRFSGQACTARIGGKYMFTNFRISAFGIRAILAGFADERRRDWQHYDPLPDGSPLFECQVRISADAVPGPYPISPSGLLVIRAGWQREHATATDGEIVVMAAPTPSVQSEER